MTATTQRMRVANEAFLLDRLAADAPRLQLYRELTQNAIEAIHRRRGEGDESPGHIRWDIDWLGVRNGKFKLSITDNGDGMSAEEMQRYLNNLAVQGANQDQSLTGNFGVGAKVTALFHNKDGLVYLSWRDGVGNSVWLHRDEEEEVYGLKLLDDARGVPTYVRPMSDSAKPSIVDQSGTKVVLLGNHPDDETWKPEGIVGGRGATNWLYKYLNTRYFTIPDGIRIQVRNLRSNPDQWPLEEPPSSDSTFNFETIRGMKAILDKQVEDAKPDAQRAAGMVRLNEVNVHWWLFEDRAVVDKNINPRAMPPGHIGIIFQDELYTVRTGNGARKLMALFGILYGSDSIVLYVEPRESAGSVHADTTRSRVIVNGADADSADLWARWGDEFRDAMPSEIKLFMERLLSADTDDSRLERRERILERLQRIRELLNPSRYRRSAHGRQNAINSVTGGNPASDDAGEAKGSARAGRPGGRSADDYLAQLAVEMGEPAEPVKPRPAPPDTRWISTANGLRGLGELEDRAADIPGDPVKGPVIRLNEDFRGFTDLFAFFVREHNADGDDYLTSRVRDVVKEWVETQALEIVLAVRGLHGNSFWTSEQLEKALSPEALTTALMGRYFVIERVRRVLRSELGKVRPRPEAA